MWNHTFFWESMKPGGGGAPSGALAAAIARDFGSLESLKAALKEAALTQFGSGWAWLVVEANGRLAVAKTANAGARTEQRPAGPPGPPRRCLRPPPLPPPLLRTHPLARPARPLATRRRPAVCPLVSSPGATPILAIDAWEHAYYLDFQNRRGDYVSVFLERLVDWKRAEARFAAAPKPQH